MTQTGHHGGWRALALLAALAGFALALIGIGGQADAAGGAAHASKAPTVGIVDFTFKPATLTVGVGSRVTFANRSKVVHTATRKGGFDTGTIAPGKSAAVSFKRKGAFSYMCSIHPAMRGKIVVD